MSVKDQGRDVLHQSATPARILFDSSLSSFPVELDDRTPSRHLLFVDPYFDIHMRVAACGSSKEICGQVIPRLSSDRAVQLTLFVQGEELQATTATDDFGEFSFDNVPSGDVVIEILTPSRHLTTSFDA